MADDTALMVRGALDGVGLDFVIKRFVADSLASGTLVRVLEDWRPAPPRFSLHYPGRRHVSAPSRR